ncbi:thioredoxin family protein [uncultured Winogradskyella sp.]|uniref:thioredoxin family protein n=1 Tax=uncultured Winogradskyella sp. TaxID=395353 RepID=UPI0026277620|nr:thioredoxin family protein [uncultured Winogradskyella sp.]
MKTNIITIIIIALFTFQINAQLNTEIIEEGETPFLLGKINKKGLEGENYKSWFTSNYNNYEPNSEIIDKISSKLKTYNIQLFMGTWCGDSKQEVPKLYRVLEACNFPMEQLTVIAVSRKPDMYKQSPQHEEAGLNIHRVPTIIFYKNNIEVNRIVEHPIDSFEEDIKNIITENNYISNYQIVASVDAILEQKGQKGLNRKQKKLLKTYKGKVSSMYELNTYGRILYSTNRIEDAITVFTLNTKLFPEEPRTHMTLANSLSTNGNKERAIDVLNNAIKLLPNNADLKENLKVIKSN